MIGASPSYVKQLPLLYQLHFLTGQVVEILVKFNYDRTYLLNMGRIYPIVQSTVSTRMAQRDTSILLAMMWAFSAGMPLGGPVSPPGDGCCGCVSAILLE